MNKPGQLIAMISSTALDLPIHRERIWEACSAMDVHAIGMEALPARDANGIAVSREMVDKADVYLGVYAWRYGWVPDFDNPDGISITEMEFNRALERKDRGELKEILVFIMHDDHPIKASDKEDGDRAQQRLQAFKDRASSGRVVRTFESPQELKTQVVHALANFKERIEPNKDPITPSVRLHKNLIPTAPQFYAEPDYIGSHPFVGRESQLQDLSDWAAKSDPTNLLLFEAIGGNGKSMLTWEWVSKHAPSVRQDWAGRLWYSFYERGAIMADFCRHALAYMTGTPVEGLRKKKTAELRGPLLAELHARPWLLVLDGLERVLVAYHRIDAAEVPDEEANHPTDKMASRDPCDAIREEDSELLRALAAASPSKILVSSRLTPRVLLNPSHQPIAGAKRVTLPGLRPRDAEEMLRQCGVRGDSTAIRSYVTENCDNHPLVIGVLAGLINDYLPDKGNFDAWSADASGGGQLNLAKLDLVQRRNHILKKAIDGLPEKSAQLLSTLAILPSSADYEMLAALNPHLPPEPQEVKIRREPTLARWWEVMTDDQEQETREASEARRSLTDFLEAPRELEKTVGDLERRGLLQYDDHTKRYDLHPVVRGVAAGGLRHTDQKRYGQLVVDYFSAKTQSPYEEAQTLEDVQVGLNLVRALLKMGQFERVAERSLFDLASALMYNLEAPAELLSLLRPFFSAGWGDLPCTLDSRRASFVASYAAWALGAIGEKEGSRQLYTASLTADLRSQRWSDLCIELGNMASRLEQDGRIAKAEFCVLQAIELASLRGISSALYTARLRRLSQLADLGRWAEAEKLWAVVTMDRDWTAPSGLEGRAEREYAYFHFLKGSLAAEHLSIAEAEAKRGNNRGEVRRVHEMRGFWQLEQGEWSPARVSLEEALRLARERGLQSLAAEAGLAFAKFHLGQLRDPSGEAARLSASKNPPHRRLAALWLAIGSRTEATKHALVAYRDAWADGEPYVYRWGINKATEILQQLNVPIPDFPPYDPAKDPKLPWEDEFVAAIESLRAKKDAGRSIRRPVKRQ